jgi:hypothetical protein
MVARWTSRPKWRPSRDAGRRLLYIAVALGSFVSISDATAQVRAFERLIMPGPLATAHAQYEQDCGSCHVRFARESQTQLCQDCHKEIARDLAARTGFHGRSPDVVGKDCSVCHSDHKGRDADIRGLDPLKFDHGITDFALVGKHAALKCADCHVPGRPFHDAKTECGSCHQKDDRHHGNLGEACAECHSETAWREVRFDHERTAHYSLTGAHAKVQRCAACHVDEHYKGTPDSCIGCHRAADKHMGRNGPNCQDCHSTTDWKHALFDHFQRTNFALRGGHSGLACEACHRSNRYETKLPTDCHGCHAADDRHAGRNGPKCADCHQVSKWADVTFDHERDAHFALHGAHAALKCAQCHAERVDAAKPAKDCIGCHRADDPHAGQLGERCGSCHGEVDWKESVRFDHGLSRFPLLGKHRDVQCDGCHETPKFHDAKRECVECHRDHDAHKRALGNDCALCHNANDWLAWSFDHAKQTRFALDGAHAGIECGSCHRRAVSAAAEIKLDTACLSCHRKDDAHAGEFGPQCERCHTTESFKQLRVLR